MTNDGVTSKSWLTVSDEKRHMVNLDIWQPHLREFQIYFCHLKPSATKTLLEAYSKAALSTRSCRKLSHRFKNGEFDVENTQVYEVT